jgi:hypothetical protein
MRKTTIIIIGVALTFIAAAAFAHAGHVHTFLGTVKTVSADQLTIRTRDGKDASFTLNEKTAYLREGAAATRADLVNGLRVAVTVADDGKTATSIKLAH